MNQATVIDLGACIGCEACAAACRAEHDLPPGVSRLHFKALETGTFPDMNRAFQINRCQDCADAPCATICPTGALHRRPDGALTLDAESCLGCRACLAACPYDALTMHPETGLAERCDGCAHRVDQGLEPACAVACPTGAIQVGDRDDPLSAVARAVASGQLLTRRAELGTRPRVHYRGALIDPLQSRSVGLFAAREQHDPQGLAWREGPALVASDGHPRVGLDVRAALLTWTQALSAGVYLVPALAVLLGALPGDQTIWRIVAPIIGLLYLLGSVGVLSWTAERRGRLALIVRRPNLSSWLARGALAGLALGVIMALQLLSTLAGLPLDGLLIAPGLALALALPAHSPMALRQCRGRALWRPAHSVPRAIFASAMMGGAMLLPFVGVICPEYTGAFAASAALGALGWVGLAGVDLLLPAPTPEGQIARRELRAGPWRWLAWGGALLGLSGLLAPLLGPWITLPVLAGPLLFNHAFLGAGQSAPQV